MKLYFMPLWPGCHIPADMRLNLLITWDLSPSAHERQEGDRWLCFKIPLSSEVRFQFESLIIKQKNIDFLFGWKDFQFLAGHVKKVTTFILLQEESWTYQKSTTLLRCIREVRSRGNQRDRQEDTEHHNSQETHTWGEPPWEVRPIADELLEAQCGRVWELRTPGAPSHGESHTSWEFYLLEPYQVLTVGVGEKSPEASSRRRGKEPLWNGTEHSVALKNTCLRGSHLPWTCAVGVIRA